MPLPVFEVFSKTDGITVVVDADIQLSAGSIQHACDAAHDVVELLALRFAHFFAGTRCGEYQRCLELHVLAFGSVVFTTLRFAVDVEFLHYFLFQGGGDSGVAFGIVFLEHVVRQHHTGYAAFEFVRRRVCGSVQAMVVFRFSEPGHHFQTVENHSQHRVVLAEVAQPFESFGIDAPVGGIVLVLDKQSRVRFQFGRQCGVVDGQSHKPGIAQIIVGF